MKKIIKKFRLLFRKKRKRSSANIEYIPRRPKSVKIDGRENQVFLTNKKGRKIKAIKGLTLVVKGNNNVVKIHNAADFFDMAIWVEGDNCIFEFEGSNRYFKNSVIKVLNGGSVKIGKNGSMVNRAFICSSEAGIVLGEDCMLASDVTIRDNDAHNIINKKGVVINKPQEVIIGDHVWLGMRTIVLKGAKIGNNCITGAGSIILAQTPTEDNCIIAGNPAKIVERNTNWMR